MPAKPAQPHPNSLTDMMSNTKQSPRDKPCIDKNQRRDTLASWCFPPTEPLPTGPKLGHAGNHIAIATPSSLSLSSPACPQPPHHNHSHPGMPHTCLHTASGRPRPLPARPPPWHLPVRTLLLTHPIPRCPPPNHPHLTTFTPCHPK